MTELPRFASFDRLAEAFGEGRFAYQLADQLTALIRHKQAAAAEAALASYIALFPDAGLRQIVGTFGAGRLVIAGWDGFYDGIRHYKAGVAAIALSGHGIDYTGSRNHLDGTEQCRPERIGLECYYYTEQHPMVGDQAALAGHLDEHGDSWFGDFDGIDVALLLNGADPMLAALRKVAAETGRDDPARRVMLTICEWWLMLHVHRAVERDLAKLDFGRDVPVLVTSHDFGDGFASFYHASGDVHPVEFEAARPRDQEEIAQKLRHDFVRWTEARRREKKRAKREEREYLDRDGELTAGAENLLNMFRAYRKGDTAKVVSEGANLVSNFRKLYRKYDY